MNYSRDAAIARLQNIRENTEVSSEIKVGDKVRITDKSHYLCGAVGRVIAYEKGSPFTNWEEYAITIIGGNPTVRHKLRRENIEKVEEALPATPPPPMPPSKEELLKEEEPDPIQQALAWLRAQYDSVSEEAQALADQAESLLNAIEALEEIEID